MAGCTQTPGRLLIIEDEAVCRKCLVQLLRRAGVDALEAGTLEEALPKLEFEQIDGVILDLCLPGVRGLDALRILRQRTSVPILILTGSDSSLAVEAMRQGADGFALKPIDIDTLLENLERARSHRSKAVLLDDVERCVSKSAERLKTLHAA